jgi:VWFA-related protein
VNRLISIAALAASLSAPLIAQGTPAAQETPADTGTTLQVTSRAVLIDVMVTDKDGKPVKGLTKDSFRVYEQGKPQTIAYFEEHRGLTPEKQRSIAMPQLPEDVFSNYSPIGMPPAVNILLLDSMNTPMADQMYLRQAAEHYLKTLKPGSRLAIFTLGLRLQFVEGFSDDPALLASALGYRKNDAPEPAVLMQSQEETNAQDAVTGLMNRVIGSGPSTVTSAAPAGMIQAFQQFLSENHYAQTADREYRTTQALQQLASYLASFPGRKNLIWLSGGFPLDLFGLTDMRFDDLIPKTVNLLAAARVSVYPVDVRGAWTPQVHSAENTMDATAATPQQLIGPAVGYTPPTTDPSTIDTGNAAVTVTSGSFSHQITSESLASNTSNASMDMFAEQTGGKAFYNSNDLSRIIGDVVGSSSDFYTLSYTPTDSNMNGAFRKIAISLDGRKYSLSYRRGYYAREEGAPGSAQAALSRAIVQAAQTRSDPLQPFMDFGLPQSEQILYTERILPADGSAPGTVNASGNDAHYAVDFTVTLNDLDLKLSPSGLHTGTLNLSLIVYDKYGQIAMRRDHLVALNIKPDAWETMQKNGGLHLHADLDVPKGQYWLRTGIYDQSTRKVGTMEVPFSVVHPVQATAQVPVGR